MLSRGHGKSQRFSRLNMRTWGKPVLPVETSRSAKKIMSLINLSVSKKVLVSSNCETPPLLGY